jgi:hypothetical protein
MNLTQVCRAAIRITNRPAFVPDTLWMCLLELKLRIVQQRPDFDAIRVIARAGAYESVTIDKGGGHVAGRRHSLRIQA